MSIRLTVEFKIQDGKASQFEEVAGSAARKVRADDKGCEAYDLFRSVDDGTRYVLVESWATKEDLEAHGSSPAMAEMGKIREFLAGRPTMHRYED